MPRFCHVYRRLRSIAAGLPWMRSIDLAVATSLLIALALPLGLAWVFWGARAQRVWGRGGVAFVCWRLGATPGRKGVGPREALSAGSSGSSGLSGLSWSSWFSYSAWPGIALGPLLWCVLRGQMALVGPRLRAIEESVPAATLAVRPGLINSWWVRRRTRVTYGCESQADALDLGQRGFRQQLGLLLRGLLVVCLPEPEGPLAVRVRVGDVGFDNVDTNDAIERLGQMLDGTRAHHVLFVNPACVNIAARHRGYRRALANAALVLPDGIGIKIGSDLLGTPLKQNVNGTDLFPALCDLLQIRRAKLFLLGGGPGIAQAVADVIGRRWPGVEIVGVRHGYFSVREEGEVVARIRSSGAHIVLVARGVPAQDLFIHRYLPLLGVRVAMGVGGLFDFVSGRIERAPLWMREIGLEWTYRLAQEPRRLWRRYLVGNLTFLTRIGLQWAGRSPAEDRIEPAERTTMGPTTLAALASGADPAAKLGSDLSRLFAQGLAHLIALGLGVRAQRYRLVLARRGGSRLAEEWGERLAVLEGRRLQWLRVARGVQHWFGVRSRSAEQWAALPAEWQAILQGQPIGMFPAPAWAEARSDDWEAGAVADVFWAMASPSARFWSRFNAAQARWRER